MNGIEYINIDVINVVNEQIIFLQSTMPWEVKKINKYWLKCFKLVLRYWENTPYHNAFCQVVKIEVILEQFKKKNWYGGTIIWYMAVLAFAPPHTKF